MIKHKTQVHGRVAMSSKDRNNISSSFHFRQVFITEKSYQEPKAGKEPGPGATAQAIKKHCVLVLSSFNYHDPEVVLAQ